MDKDEAQRAAAEARAMSHARKQLKKQMRNAGVRRLDVAMPPAAPRNLPIATQPPTTQRRQLAPPHQQNRKAPLIGVPLDGDLSVRAAFFDANMEFLNAADREAELVAISRMWATAMEAMGITSPFLEAPGAAMAQLAIMDLLSGRGSRLLQHIPRTDGKKPPRHSQIEWAAINGVLLCAAVLQKVEGLGLEKAMWRVVEDIEDKDLGGKIDACLSQGTAVKIRDKSKNDNRRTRLVNRFIGNRDDLRDPNTAAGREMIGELYRRDVKAIEAETVDSMRARDLYLLTRVTTANLLRKAKAEVIQPKGGKGLRLEKDE